MTYSTTFGNPSIEATNYNSLQFILEQLPDNTGQLISPRDVRDAVFTTWEKGIFKTIELGSETYIGTDNGGTVSNYRYKMFLGKKQLQTGNDILNNTLLTSDTDIFIYNNKSDSNLSLQDTKISFLAGDDFSLFTNAPYLEATKISGSPSRIDLNLTNPSSGGIIEINSDIIELGDNNGWVIDDTTGDLYPQNDGQNIGLTGTGNRIGTIYMASTVDYLNNLEFVSGSSSITFDTNGMITTKSLYVTEDLQFQVSATSGYFLSTDTSGNAIWSAGKIDTVGITAGYMNIADGVDDVDWVKPYADATGITAGYILQSAGNPPNYGASGVGARPEWRSLSNLDTSGVTAGYILGSDGSNSQWVPISSGAGGSSSNIQFNNGGFLDGDSDLTWDNSTKTLSVSGSGTFSDVYLGNRLWSADSSNYIDLSNPQGGINMNFGGTSSISVADRLEIISDRLNFESPTLTKFSVEDQGFEVESDGNADIRFLNGGHFEFINNSKVDLNLRYEDSFTPISGIISSIRGMVGTNSNSNIYSSIGFHENSGGGEIKFRTTDTPTNLEPTERMVINSVGNVGINETNPMEIFHLNLTEENRKSMLIESQITSTQSMSINFSSINANTTDAKNFSLSIDKASGQNFNILNINSLNDNLSLKENILQISNTTEPSVGIKGIEFTKSFYVNGDVRFDGKLESRYAVRRLYGCRLDTATGTFSIPGAVHHNYLIFDDPPPLVPICDSGSSYQIADEYLIIDDQNLDGNTLYIQNPRSTSKSVSIDSGSNIIVPHNNTTPINSISLAQGESVLMVFSVDSWFVYKLN